MIIAGIDPGLSGAVALLSPDAGTVRTFDMPTLVLPRAGKNKREIDAHQLARLFADSAPHHVFIEQVGAMPGQGVSSVFAFGKAYGIVIGVLAAQGIRMTTVAPHKWKHDLRVPAAKDGARARASQLFPAGSDQWARVKDSGRAEAALIALWGAQTFGLPAQGGRR